MKKFEDFTAQDVEALKAELIEKINQLQQYIEQLDQLIKGANVDVRTEVLDEIKTAQPTAEYSVETMAKKFGMGVEKRAK